MKHRHWLALVFSCVVFAQSPPPQTPRVLSQTQNRVGGNKESEQKDYKRPSDKNITSVDQSHSESTARQEPKSNESDDKSSLNSILITFFTGGLVLVAVLQWLAIRKQATYMRRALLETEKSADAAKLSAQTAAQTFINSHRPKLTVRFMAFNQSGEITPELVLEGRFFVYNIGHSKAILQIQHTEVFIGSYLPALNPYEGKPGQPIDTVLEPGNATAITFPTLKPAETLKHSRQWTTFAGRPGVQGGFNASHVFVIGWIKYSDEVGREYSFGFSRRFDWLTQRFNRVQDQDYEYDD